jgi:hypothetical protein
MAASIKMMVFWDVMLCSLIEKYQCIERTCCLHIQGRHLKMKTEAAGSSETFVPIYQTGWHHIPEERNLEQFFSSSY